LVRGDDKSLKFKIKIIEAIFNPKLRIKGQYGVEPGFVGRPIDKNRDVLKELLGLDNIVDLFKEMNNIELDSCNESFARLPQGATKAKNIEFLIKDEKSSQAFTEITGQESNEILNNTIVKGAPEGFKGKVYTGVLTPEILKSEGLEPKFKIEIDGKSVWLSSKIYDLGHGRIATIAYVKNKAGKYVARSYYRSNSQGVWRYLPEYRALPKNNETLPDRIIWYGKGHSEFSITLPVEAQKVLAALSKPENVIKIKDPEFVFAGTARNSGRKENLTDSYNYEVNPNPKILNKEFMSENGLKNPSELNFNNTPGLAPDFSKKIDSYSQDS